MIYEKYQEIVPKEEYLKQLPSINELTEELKETVYNKYVVKCKVFQRDEFACQNVNCKEKSLTVTLHHIKWKKNGGKDSERNCITLCKICHTGFHKGKIELVIKERPELLAHISGHTFKYEKEQEINWKKIRVEMRQLRRNVRHLWGTELTDQQWRILMAFLFSGYEDDDEE